MTRIAYLSMDSLEAFECYDHLTIPPLAALGHEVEAVSWRGAIDWGRYDYVIVRSPWDYQDDAGGFMTVLEAIDASRATLLNPLSVMRWNIDKRYLRELQEQGVAIVPTQWSEDLSQAQVEEALARFASSEIIVKPAVSANADDTFRVAAGHAAEFFTRHGAVFRDRPCLLQPFVRAILEEGEYSLFYFAGRLSHTILKTPRRGDFRVQEEHGGRLQLVPEPAAALVDAGRRALEGIGETLLYARLDFVREGAQYLLMEAELIEPSLYFNMDPASPRRFAAALDAWIAAGEAGRGDAPGDGRER